ncbi:UNVERIFIED_CONTAM: Geranylgeranyl diphosphate reductase, chloroplastic [Sesamum angustifolium]|uniref:Geranylgeranyl diphosphate reductase, chloroplastic n=1 Tax=Sesamum angustifolium TaxID=2727405 RepID=A0AAW2KL99_9LAMI
MKYYENLAEMYVGEDVSPDFYGWVFPKCDHVAVGTGTVTHKGDIKKFQLATRLRARDKIEGGKSSAWKPTPSLNTRGQASPRQGGAGRRRRRVCYKMLRRGNILRGEERADVR